MSEGQLGERIGWKGGNGTLLTSPSQFDAFLPVLWMCRELSVPLVAVAPSADVVSQVREDGFGSLDSETRKDLLQDPEGLIDSLTDPIYAEYEPPLLLAPPRNTLLGASPAANPSGERPRGLTPLQALQDEAVASKLAQYASTNKDVLLVSLMGMERVKYGLGAPSRTLRLLGSGARSVLTVLLNPTIADTGRDPHSGGMRLELSSPSGSSKRKNLLLADYLWYSSLAPMKVRERAERWKRTR